MSIIALWHHHRWAIFIFYQRCAKLWTALTNCMKLSKWGLQKKQTCYGDFYMSYPFSTAYQWQSTEKIAYKLTDKMTTLHSISDKTGWNLILQEEFPWAVKFSVWSPLLLLSTLLLLIDRRRLTFKAGSSGKGSLLSHMIHIHIVYEFLISWFLSTNIFIYIYIYTLCGYEGIRLAKHTFCCQVSRR